MTKNDVCRVLILFFLTACSCKKEKQNNPPVVQPPPADSSSYTAEEIEGFNQMTVDTTQRIVKWQSLVSVYVADTSFPYLTKQLDSVISEVNTLLSANLSIKRVSTPGESSVQVYFTDEDTYLKQEPAAGIGGQKFYGFGYARWDTNSDYIYHGSIFVDTAYTASDTLLQRFVILHEFIHTLGFVGHVTEPTLSSVMFPYPSIPYLPDYTDFDKKMIRLLYSPSIKAGMTKAECDTAIAHL